MEDFINYDDYTKDQWRSFYQNVSMSLTKSTLRQINNINNQISLQDVQDIYFPLLNLLKIEIHQFHKHQSMRQKFLQQYHRFVPYIIGIAGSVSVGKSTTAKLLKVLIKQLFSIKNVEVVTTDNFLYSTDELKKRDLLNRKGFPETYNTKALINFLNEIKMGKSLIDIPVYSKKIYDIMTSEVQQVIKPSILIVEGINTLQLSSKEQYCMSDFMDFTIYIDANENLIERWFIERFHALLKSANNDPCNYYYKYAVELNLQTATKIAKHTWRTINLPNLVEYILPTKNRADLILHKSNHHRVDRILLRKFI